MRETGTEARPKVTIFTDGACDPNPGPGGWAALLKFDGREEVISGYEPHSTNNRMELTAGLQALKLLNTPHRIELYTDSEYLKFGITEWLPVWKARNWKRKGGRLANHDLWQELDAATLHHKINWHWLRGHTGNPENERVDRLAKLAIRQSQENR